MSAFSAMFDAIFADPNIAEDAVFTPSGGSAVNVRIVRRAADLLTDVVGQRLVSETNMIQVRVSEVPAPKAGDTFQIGGVTHTVLGAPQRDDTRLVWKIDAPAAA